MTCNVDPNIYGGNFVQTLFLGATVVSYTATLGWNSSPTEVQVMLVEDPYFDPGVGKLYYSGCVTPKIHYGPDYFNPPPLGYPVVFIFGSFYFCGVLQNWKYITDSTGRKISVKISSPIEILSGTSVVLGGYNGPVYTIPNLINVYSFLEQNGDSWPVVYDPGLHDTLGYYPITGFGGSYKNDAGIPWNLIRDALVYIINYGGGSTIFGGRIKLRDVSYLLDISELPYISSLRISGDSKDLLSIISEVCDVLNRDFFVEIQLTNIQGSNACTENVFSELGDIAGRIDGRLGAFVKIRTVRRTDQPVPAKMIDSSIDTPLEERLSQGVISSYAKSLESQNLDRGLELRPETTNVMVVGGQREDIFQIPFYIVDGEFPNCFNTTIWHYWGKDANGFPLVSNGFGNDHIVWFDIAYKFDPVTEAFLMAAINDGRAWSAKYDHVYVSRGYRWQKIYGNLSAKDRKIAADAAYSQIVSDPNYVLNALGLDPAKYAVKFGKEYSKVRDEQGNWINIIKVNYTVIMPFYKYSYSANMNPNTSYYPIECGEMTSALCGYEEWVYWMSNEAPPWKRLLISNIDGGSGFGIVGWNSVLKWYKRILKASGFKNTSLINAYRHGLIDLPTSDSDVKRASEKLYDYIFNLVDENYGKKFQVSVNDLRIVPDSSEIPYGSKANYTITSAGWTEESHVLGMLSNGVDIALFKEESTGKLYGFAIVNSATVGRPSNKNDIFTYSGAFLDLTSFGETDYKYINELEAYVRFDVEEITYLDPVAKTHPRVIIKFHDRMFSSYTASPNLGDDDPNPLANVYPYKADWRTALSNERLRRVMVGADSAVAGTTPIPAFPMFVALPLKSTELSYGPWVAKDNNRTFIVDANKTEFIKDNDLTPWNYGSTINMDAAGQTLANSKIVQQNIIEFGNFTLPGLPRFSIGQVAMSFGPELTDFSISVGDGGLSTTYGMKTYTPNHGTLGKIRIDQIRKQGSYNLKMLTNIQKVQSESASSWKGRGRGSASRIMGKNDASTRTSSQSFFMADSQTEWLPYGTIVAGGVIVPGIGPVTFDNYYINGYPLLDLGTKINNVAITDYRKCMPEFDATNPTGYQTKAGVCTEGLFRPYSTWQDDPNFPGFTYWDNFQGAYDPVKYYDYSDNLTRYGLTPVSGAGQPPINSWTMSPFPEGSGIDIDMTAPNFKMGLAYNGHDIEYVVRDGSYPIDLSVRLPYDNYSQDGWYRSVGLKAPLILVGWGYDLDGYPVPNKNPNSPTAYFEDDWLRKPQDWKAGPIDLRWDDDRGVWTSPMPFSVVRIKALTTESAAGPDGGKTFVAKILDDITAYDKDGTVIENKIIVRNYTTTVVAVNDTLYAKYSPNGKYGEANFTKYELISSPQQTVGGSTAIYTILTTGGSSNVGASGLVTQSTAAGDSLVGSGCILISGPDISGYSYLAFRSYPNPNCPEIRMTPYSAPNPIVDATVVSATTANLTSRTYLRTILNTMNLPNALPCAVQWNGSNWITVNSQCYNAPVLEIS